MRKLSKLALCLCSLLLLTSAKLKADYLDVTYKDGLSIDTKFMAQKVIFASSIYSGVETVGLGGGYRDKHFQVYYGLNYNSNEKSGLFLHGFYKSNRHAYEAEMLARNDEVIYRVGYNYLTTESFGLYCKIDTGSGLVAGLRKWF